MAAKPVTGSTRLGRRVAGEGILDVHGRPQHVRECNSLQRRPWGFFDEVLMRYVRRKPLVNRLFLRWLVRDILAETAAATSTHPVYEVRSVVT